jgi:aminobenzoyl-glutamate utilization protein B
VQAATAIDFLLTPSLVEEAWKYFREVQTKDLQYQPLIGPEDKPALWMNREKMERYRPAMRKLYYDPAKYPTYLEQLGVKYPTIRKP